MGSLRSRGLSFGRILALASFLALSMPTLAEAQYVRPGRPDKPSEPKPEKPKPVQPKPDDTAEGGSNGGEAPEVGPAPPPIHEANPGAPVGRPSRTSPRPRVQSTNCATSGSSGGSVNSPWRAVFWAVGMGVSPFRGSVQKDWAPGVDFGLGLTHLDFPLSVGFDLGAAFWGSRVDTMSVDTSTGPVDSTFRSQDQVVFGDAWLRLQPELSIFRPYVEGVLGGKFLATSYSYVDGYDFDKITKNTGTAFSYGLGAGLDTKIASFGATDLFINVGFRYLAGPTIPVDLTVNGQLGPVSVETNSLWIFGGLTIRSPFLQRTVFCN